METAAVIASSLTALYNQSLKNGVVPAAWKQSLIASVPKEDCR